MPSEGTRNKLEKSRGPARLPARSASDESEGCVVGSTLLRSASQPAQCGLRKLDQNTGLVHPEGRLSLKESSALPLELKSAAGVS